LCGKVLYSIKEPKTLYEMNYEEVAEALKETDIVLVPAGAVEGHGAHLPLGADSIQARDFGTRMQEQLAKEGIKVVVAPVMPFGPSEGLMEFPGTISLSVATMTAVLKDICKSLYRHGFRRFVLLYAHGGDLGPMKQVAPELAAELPRSQFIVPDWLPLMHDKYPEILTSERAADESHGGEGETARVLTSAPELVDFKRAKVFYLPKKSPVDLTRVTMAIAPRSLKERSPAGSIGNPILATKETGDKVYEVLVNWLCDVTKAAFGLGE